MTTNEARERKRTKARKIGVLTAAFVAAVGLLSVTAPPDTVSADNHDPFTDGDELMVFVNILSGDSIQGGHLDGWVNEYPDGDDFSQIGGIGLVRNPDGCSELSCAEWHVGYCSESDEQIHALEYEPYFETSIDPRLSYLIERIRRTSNYASGNAIAQWLQPKHWYGPGIQTPKLVPPCSPMLRGS